jgi:two-component system chemotaxis response regulator CheY
MTAAAPGNGVRSVLVVDDDPFIRRLIVTTLEDIAGFELFEAADGEQAVTMAEQIGPAVVLLDIDMPRLDGIEACRRLRGLPGGGGATIVMLTAAAAGQESVARAAGADLFLTKPFSPLDLLRLVDELGERDPSPGV